MYIYVIYVCMYIYMLYMYVYICIKPCKEVLKSYPQMDNTEFLIWS